jgi:hypothetical protein
VCQSSTCRTLRELPHPAAVAKQTICCNWMLTSWRHACFLNQTSHGIVLQTQNVPKEQHSAALLTTRGFCGGVLQNMRLFWFSINQSRPQSMRGSKLRSRGCHVLIFRRTLNQPVHGIPSGLIKAADPENSASSGGLQLRQFRLRVCVFARLRSFHLLRHEPVHAL